MILPKGYTITSFYGYRLSPFLSYHNGIDIPMPVGSNVYSPCDGVVENSYYDSNGGNQIIIRCDEIDGDEYRYGFAHLSSRKVRKGNRVEEGQLIGLSGNTGRSTGAHLHFTTSVNGKRVNPLRVYGRFDDSPVVDKNLLSIRGMEFKKKIEIFFKFIFWLIIFAVILYLLVKNLRIWQVQYV